MCSPSRMPCSKQPILLSLVDDRIWRMPARTHARTRRLWSSAAAWRGVQGGRSAAGSSIGYPGTGCPAPGRTGTRRIENSMNWPW